MVATRRPSTTRLEPRVPPRPSRRSAACVSAQRRARTRARVRAPVHVRARSASGRSRAKFGRQKPFGPDLLNALGIRNEHAMTHRGGPLVYKPQTLTRVQEGKYVVGTNRAHRALRLRAARQNPRQLLSATGTRAEEKTALYTKLRGVVEADPRQREAPERRLLATRCQWQEAWREWEQRQHRKSGGQIFK